MHEDSDLPNVWINAKEPMLREKREEKPRTSAHLSQIALREHDFLKILGRLRENC